MYRRHAAAARKLGFSVTVSDRALIIRDPTLAPFAHAGTKLVER